MKSPILLKLPAALLMLLTLLLSTIPGGSFAAHAPYQQTESLSGIFRDVAAEFNVPVDLLIALGWSRSHLRNQKSEAKEYGMMQLPAQNPNQILQAAQLLNQSEIDIKFNNRQNIRGAAVLLRQMANNLYPDQTTLSTEAWFKVVAAFSFPANPAVGQEHAQQLFKILGQGLNVQVEGETLVVQPWPNARRLSTPSRVTIASDDYTPAYWIAAHPSNFTDSSRDATDIDMIVIHTTEASYSAVLNWFIQPNKYSSAHYFIRSGDGAVAQMVRDEDVAWHAGDWDTNLRSIGIEHEAFVDDASWYSESMYAASARLVKYLAHKYNIPLDREHIIGHGDVPGCPYSGGGASCHTDPGPHWNWDHFMSLVIDTAPTPTSTPTTSPPPFALETGHLIGLVYNAKTNQRLSDAWVSAGEQLVQTNQNGVYILTGLPVGNVPVTVELAGFAVTTQIGHVEPNTTRWNSFWLAPLPTASPTKPAATATASPSPIPSATLTPTPTPLPTRTPTAVATATSPPPLPTPADQTGTLVGLIRDAETGKRLAGVTVSVLERIYVTDTRGYYRFDRLPVGAQRVTAGHVGYQTQQKTGQVIDDETRWNSIELNKISSP